MDSLQLVSGLHVSGVNTSLGFLDDLLCRLYNRPTQALPRECVMIQMSQISTNCCDSYAVLGYYAGVRVW